MTPHINAKKEDVANFVLMPGDPLRAKYIAETFLTQVKHINKVRNMFMYTGYYKNKKVTIAGSGMGCPSIGIYSYELFKFYDVDCIIRVGSCGSYTKDLKVYDTVLAKEAYSDSNSFAKLMLNKEENISFPSKKLNEELIASAKELKIEIKNERVHSSDVFYDVRNVEERIRDTKASCVEMESFALFINAEVLNKKAACLLTVSDNIVTKEVTSSEERQTKFKDMMKIALETSLKF